MDRETRDFVYKSVLTVFVMILTIVCVTRGDVGFMEAILTSAVVIALINFLLSLNES